MQMADNTKMKCTKVIYTFKHTNKSSIPPENFLANTKIKLNTVIYLDECDYQTVETTFDRMNNRKLLLF